MLPYKTKTVKGCTLLCRILNLFHTSYRFHNISQRIKIAHGITVLKLSKTMYSNKLSKDSKLTLCLLASQTAFYILLLSFIKKTKCRLQSSIRGTLRLRLCHCNWKNNLHRVENGEPGLNLD